MNEATQNSPYSLCLAEAHRWIEAVGLHFPISAMELGTAMPMEKRDVELAFLYYAACYAILPPDRGRYFAGTARARHILSVRFPRVFWKNLLGMGLGRALQRLAKDMPVPSVEDVANECRMRYSKVLPNAAQVWTLDPVLQRRESWRQDVPFLVASKAVYMEGARAYALS